uniref:Hopanoid-associated phosphorylase n=1 Tax=Candidatus Kentrum sp. MB TaxID=2138164 RepID=A0A451BC39_9GAMM|nr:MAG: hopanoid-associated phosphorylase [Candidatus Kentron sp. MB]
MNTGSANAKLGIIAALPLEIKCLSRIDVHPGSCANIADNSILYYAGIGQKNAAQAAQFLIDSGANALVSWGTAGALHPRLTPGDIVLPLAVIDHAQNRLYPVDQRWHGALKSRLEHGLNPKTIHSQQNVVSTREVQSNPRQKKILHQTTGAIAVDMESAAIAAVASKENKPFVVIRGISDTVAMRLPQSALKATDRYGKISLLGLSAALLRTPTELRHYPALIRALSKTKRSLRQVVALCGLHLCLEETL